MAVQQPKAKGFFGKYWGLLLGGAALAGIIFIAAAVLIFVFFISGNATVTEVSLSTDTIVYGKPLEAVVKVENTGMLSYDYHAALTVDGAEGATKDITLESKQRQTIKLDLSKLKPGQHKISIGGKEKEFKVLKPATFVVSDIAVSTEELMMGEDLTVSATVSNTGEVEGTYAASFTYDGAAASEAVVKLGPGDKEKVEAKVTTADRGKHTIGLGDLKKTISVLSPANIKVTSTITSLDYAKPNDEVTLTASLENTGDLTGKYTVQLMVNGVAAQAQEVTVEANGFTSVTFDVTQAKAGTYVFAIGEYTETLNVVTITRPKNGTRMVHKLNSGRGRLAIVNNYDQDAVIILTSTSNPKAPLLMVYVRSKSKVSGIKVKDGTYLIYYSFGTDWDASSRRFITNVTYNKFDETARFKTTRSGYRITWSTPTITFGTSSGGSPTSGVDESEFPG